MIINLENRRLKELREVQNRAVSDAQDRGLLQHPNLYSSVVRETALKVATSVIEESKVKFIV